ncbi:unnamed protein product [Discosporangium mesarthrocarpum]
MVDCSKWDDLPASFAGGTSATSTSTTSTPASPAQLLNRPAFASSRGLPPRGAVVFLHGSGGTGQGIREWLHAASMGRFECRLSELGLKLVCPTSPLRSYTLAGGASSRVWFDRTELSPSAKQDKAGVRRSMQQVKEELRRLEEDGVPRSGIFVGGFSMGGGLALEFLGDKECGGRLAGIFSHSGFLNEDSNVFASLPMATPVYISHGAADGMVMPEWGYLTSERLRNRGFTTSHVEHPGLEHELGKGQIEALLDWIEGVSEGFDKTPENCAYDEAAPEFKKVRFEVSVSRQDKDFSLARFSVPPGSESLLSGSSICTRGAFFNLTDTGIPGFVEASFVSPMPDLTAAAIAQRIEQRLADPSPPGVEEACCVS